MNTSNEPPDSQKLTQKVNDPQKNSILSPPPLPANEIINVPHRFNILFLLYLYSSLNYGTLRKLIHLTPGNMDYHVSALKKAGLITDVIKYKSRPTVFLKITETGRNLFQEYADHLQNLLNRMDDRNKSAIDD